MNERLAQELLAERYDTPPVPSYTQRDLDIAELAEAIDATYEDALLRKKHKPLP